TCTWAARGRCASGSTPRAPARTTSCSTSAWKTEGHGRMPAFLTRGTERAYGYRVRCLSLRVIGCALLVAAGSACGGDDRAEQENCLQPLPLDCETAFTPTYSAIFDNVISTRCGGTGTGGSCHGPDGRKGGLVLADKDEAYDYLRGDVDGRPRVVPL